MRDLLVGYLIGVLEPEEHAEVEKSLAQDESLRGDLQALGRSLNILQSKADTIRPEFLLAPAGLATRTCEIVAERANPTVSPVASRRAEQELGAPTRRGWSLLDYAVAAAVLIAAGLLVLPAINQSRFHSGVLACQNNLRQVGRALDRYSETHQGSFPEVRSGDFAGAYIPELMQASLLSDGRELICPNSPVYESRQPVHWPSREDLDNAEGEQRDQYRNTLQNAYGYTLGYVSNGQPMTRRNERDPSYALVADAPSKDHKYLRSSNHGGCGQNVLFEDGRVEYLSDNRFGKDDVFKNAHGQLAIGTNRNDSVIVPADYVVP